MVKIIFPEINLIGVKGVLIDLDDTLYSYESAHEVAMTQCHELYQKLIDPLSTFEQFKTEYRMFRDLITSELSPNASCRSRLLAFQLWFEASKLPLPYSFALQFENYYWESLIKASKVSSSGLKFLQKCQENNIPVCLVTDLTAQQQMRKIQKMNIETFITAMVTSEEAGVEKPNPRIFALALEKLNIHPNQAIMIGDHLEKDIKSAEKLGLKAYQILHEN